MLNYKKILSTTGTAAIISGLAMSGAQAATAVGTSSLEFVAPVTVTSSTNMDFGTMVSGATAGQKVVLSTDGNYAGSTTMNTLDANGTAAVFAVTTAAIADVSVAPTSVDSVIGLSAFTCKIASGIETACGVTDSYTISANGNISVGATATVKAGQTTTATTYSPIYTMTVNYQ
jgi:hypothetical protein